MGYMHILNLYKDQTILMFKECWALEKVHGTSSNISWNGSEVKLFSGGESAEKFKSLFDIQFLTNKFIDLGFSNRTVTVYGEAYGGSQQGMSDTYGKALNFIAFDVCLDETNWLNVPEADEFCKSLDIEFVPYVRISTDLKEIDAQRDAMSVVAIRRGISTPKEIEGVVLRPLIELTNSYGARIICKHKGDKFRETASPRVVEDPSKLKVLEDADKIAFEWVTVSRLEHVLDKIPGYKMESIPIVIKAMVEDVTREASNEIIDNENVRKAISKKTVVMFKDYLKSKITSG